MRSAAKIPSSKTSKKLQRSAGNEIKQKLSITFDIVEILDYVFYAFLEEEVEQTKNDKISSFLCAELKVPC